MFSKSVNVIIAGLATMQLPTGLCSHLGSAKDVGNHLDALLEQMDAINGQHQPSQPQLVGGGPVSSPWKSTGAYYYDDGMALNGKDLEAFIASTAPKPPQGPISNSIHSNSGLVTNAPPPFTNKMDCTSTLKDIMRKRKRERVSSELPDQPTKIRKVIFEERPKLRSQLSLYDEHNQDPEAKEQRRIREQQFEEYGKHHDKLDAFHKKRMYQLELFLKHKYDIRRQNSIQEKERRQKEKEIRDAQKLKKSKQKIVSKLQAPVVLPVSRKFAILFCGVDYKKTSYWCTDGSKTDVQYLKEILVGKGWKVKVVEKVNFYQMFEEFENWLQTNKIRDGDTCFFHFSGHGSYKHGMRWMWTEDTSEQLMGTPRMTSTGQDGVIPVDFFQKSLNDVNESGYKIFSLDCCSTDKKVLPEYVDNFKHHQESAQKELQNTYLVGIHHKSTIEVTRDAKTGDVIKKQHLSTEAGAGHLECPDGKVKQIGYITYCMGKVFAKGGKVNLTTLGKDIYERALKLPGFRSDVPGITSDMLPGKIIGEFKGQYPRDGILAL